MSPRQAFRIFIRHQLETMVEDGQLDLTAEQLEHLANTMEDDHIFYKRLGDMIEEYLGDWQGYGEDLSY